MSENAEDVRAFGEGVLIYCRQHLGPHFTGWCTVPATEKVKLEARTLEQAAGECRRKGLKLYTDLGNPAV